MCHRSVLCVRVSVCLSRHVRVTGRAAATYSSQPSLQQQPASSSRGRAETRPFFPAARPTELSRRRWLNVENFGPPAEEEGRVADFPPPRRPPRTHTPAPLRPWRCFDRGKSEGAPRGPVVSQRRPPSSKPFVLEGVGGEADPPGSDRSDINWSAEQGARNDARLLCFLANRGRPGRAPCGLVLCFLPPPAHAPPILEVSSSCPKMEFGQAEAEAGREKHLVSPLR